MEQLKEFLTAHLIFNEGNKLEIDIDELLKKEELKKQKQANKTSEDFNLH